MSKEQATTPPPKEPTVTYMIAEDELKILDKVFDELFEQVEKEIRK